MRLNWVENKSQVLIHQTHTVSHICFLMTVSYSAICFCLCETYILFFWSQFVIFNFMSQLHWATGCPDTWPNIILGVSVNMSLDKITFRNKSYSKWSRLPSLMWVGLIWSVEGLNRIKRPSEREHLLRECKSWNIGLFLPWAWTETMALPGSQACQLSDWNSQSTFLVLRILTRELHHQLSWVSSLPTADPETLSFQFLLINLSVYTHTHTFCWFCYSRDLWLIQF